MRTRSLAVALAALAALAVRPAAAATAYERVFVPMRDGVQLAVDIWRPTTGGPFPVILTLTPYHALEKALRPREENPPGEYAPFLSRGYAYALADVRGTYNSGGCWDYGGLDERQDGYDLVEWLAGYALDGTPTSPAAAWSSGKVAMIGASYDGTTANAAAVEQPPHLATIVPISAISRWWGYAYQQGARATYSGESADVDPPSDTPTDFMFAYGFLPPPTPNAAAPMGQAMRWTPCARVEQTMHGYDTQPDYDDFWIERDYLRLAGRVTVPVLVAHGFEDFNVKTWEGTAWFQALGVEKMLVVGQWPHQLPAYPGWTALLRRWLDRWLKDAPNDVEDEPAVRVQAGDGSWREQETWGDAPRRTFPLDGGERAYLDDGALTESEMLRGTSPERYVRIAVPGTEGPLHVEGRPLLRLAASSDRPGTHFVSVLCDVGPDGACTMISRAFMNARYRTSLEQGTDLVPGERQTFALEFIDKDWIVAAGHHLELIVASSSTTWVAPDEQRARNTLFLSDSALDLPVR